MQKEFVVRHGIIVGNNTLVVSNNKIGINTGSSSLSLQIAANDAVLLPTGNTGQRPTVANGMIRYNSQTTKFEVLENGTWNSFVPTTVSVGVGGIATGGGALTANVTITVPEANVSEYYTKTADKAIAPDTMWASANLVPLTDNTTVSVDFNSGYNFTLTLGGNRTLGNPTNVKNGQCGLIIIRQDATGSRTLSFSSNWKFANGEVPTLTSNANAVDVLSYFAVNSTFIIALMNNNAR